MSPPLWCVDLVARFWGAAGEPPPFPRDLLPAITGAVPLSVIPRPGLRVRMVCDWFAEREIELRLDEPDRPLRACLVAWWGQGFAFLDAEDDPAERRFSLAHELGHFLRDYWHPRERALTRLGPAVESVLDGQRSPTPDERIRAILRNVPLDPFTHLLRRDESGRPLSCAEQEAETAADLLAFELLAPYAAVSDIEDRMELHERLVGEIGLPPIPAARYVEILLPAARASERLVNRLLGR